MWNAGWGWWEDGIAGFRTSWTGSNWQWPGALDSCRVWVSPRPGDIEITGTATKMAAGGDGVWICIIHNSDGEYTMAYTPEFFAAGDLSDHDVTIESYPVKAGDEMIFRLWRGSPNGNAADGVYWDPTVTLTP